MRSTNLSLIAAVGVLALVPQHRDGSCRHASRIAASSGARDAALLCELNLQRRQHGLGPLRAEARLRGAAREQAGTMAERGRLSHAPAGRGPGTRLRSAGWRRDWGEVLAAGCSTLASASAAVDGWLHSPAHRRLILDPGFRWAGVGSAPAPNAGACAPELYWAVDLGG